MRTLLLFLLLLNSAEIFSQKISCENISRFSLKQIEDEIFNSKEYSIEDCKRLASMLSKNDYQNGIRRILALLGPGDNSCYKCLYNSVGYKIEPFSNVCFDSENIEIFISEYNKNMTEGLPKTILKMEFPDTVYTQFFTSETDIDLEQMSDTVIRVKVHNSLIEKLLGLRIDLVKIAVFNSDSSQKDFYSYTYSKEVGLPIKFTPQKKGNNTIKLTFDLSNVRDDINICWCHILGTENTVIIPIAQN